MMAQARFFKMTLPRSFLGIGAALALKAALAGSALAQDRPIITDVVWHSIDSYCTFMREGHEFDYNDPDSWRFVFFTQIDTSAQPVVETAFMSIGHNLRQLELVDTERAGNVETRSYRSLGANPHDVVVNMQGGEDGYEATAYSGSIEINGPLGSETVGFQGDCGV